MNGIQIIIKQIVENQDNRMNILILNFNDINKITNDYNFIDIFNLMLNKNKKLNINFKYNNFYDAEDTMISSEVDKLLADKVFD